MIIKSHIRGGFRNAADYLKEQGQNEQTRLVEISDPHTKTLDDAFRAMWAIAEGTKAKKPLHHVSINPMKDERLTDRQVLRICERLEEKYGYAKGDHQRVIVEHIKDERQHFHVMWNRVSLRTGKPHYPYMHKKQSKIVAREMEIELGLRKPTSKHAPPKFTVDTRHRHQFHTALRAKTLRKTGIKPHTNPFHPHFEFKIPVPPVIRPAAQSAHAHEKQPCIPGPIRSGKPGGMSEQQYRDFIAACEGRITWAEYFRKWGGKSLGLNRLS
jgi:hypothetical protein